MGKRWEPFRIGQVIAVLVPQRGEIREYSSKVQDLTAVSLSISAPTERGRVLDPPAGTSITLMVNEAGTLKSYGSTIERTRLGQVPLWVVAKPVAEPAEAQRRGFYRLETFLSMTFAFADPQVKVVTEYNEQGVVCNLSGGGLGMIYAHRVSIGSTLGMLLPLGEFRLALWGKVMRCDPLTNPKLTRYLLGIQFLSISQRDQDLVIKYIFKEQLRQRQKGLL
ncbi:MAG: flagellar brake protein [Bacillota bacterium]